MKILRLRIRILALALVALTTTAGCALRTKLDTGPAAVTAPKDQLPSAGREQARISDGVIRADQNFMTALRKRLAALNAGGVPARDYHLTKAGAWLDFATEEYADNDRSGIIEALLEQSVGLIRAMEAKRADLPMSTPIVVASRKIRDDLWERAERWKTHNDFLCVADRVARLEVQLVWAGHEDWEGGWRHAKPYIEIAEDMAFQIELALNACPKPQAKAPEPVVAAPVVAAPVVKPEPAPTVPMVETITKLQLNLSGDALFKFGGAALADVEPATRQTLDALIEQLRGVDADHSVVITGHTDRLGDSAYNLKLSQARADAFRQLLIGRGVAAESVQAVGVGAREPIVNCGSVTGRKALIDCLKPNRRVSVRVSAKAAPAPTR